MKEVSNKAIGILVILAIAVSVTGMTVALNKIDSMPQITGWASSTGTGQTDVTVAATTYITVPDGYIDLGTLEPGQTNNSDTVNDYFTVQNDGSKNVNLSVYDANSLFSGTGCSSTPNTCYQAKGASNQSGIAYTTYQQVQNDAGTAYVVISDLSYTDSQDEATIGVKATVPTDEPAGAKTTSMTIVATQA